MSRLARRAPLADKARNSGIHLQAARGTGKSTLEAIIALADAARNHPVVLFEVQGGLVEQLLWRLRSLDPETRKSIVRRIVYVDMSGKSGRIVGWPLLYRLPGDSLYDTARRFIELVKRLDPELTNAPIMGANALEYLGIYTGMALFAMGCQYTEATDLITHPERWTQRLREASKDKEAEPATSFFLNEYTKMTELERHNLAMTLRAKLAPFSLNPVLNAMFGAAKPGIDWEEVAEDAKLVILDFQDVRDEDVPFRMRWCFSHLWEYIKRRENVHDRPMSVIIDELSYLLSMRSGSDDLLAADLDNFINKDMRYRNIWLTVAHQELYQIPNRIKKTLLSMDTQIIGQTSDRETAELLARHYLDYDPHWTKKRIPRWAVMTDQSVDFINLGGRYSRPLTRNNQHIETIDYVTQEFTLEEQVEMATGTFLELSRFNFLLGRSGKLTKVSIRRQVEAIGFPDSALVARDRELLIERSGTPIARISEDIRQRQLSPSSAKVRRSG